MSAGSRRQCQPAAVMLTLRMQLRCASDSASQGVCHRFATCPAPTPSCARTSRLSAPESMAGTSRRAPLMSSSSHRMQHWKGCASCGAAVRERRCIVTFWSREVSTRQAHSSVSACAGSRAAGCGKGAAHGVHNIQQAEPCINGPVSLHPNTIQSVTCQTRTTDSSAADAECVTEHVNASSAVVDI